MFYTKGLNIRTQGFEKMRCSMIWDGMPYVKGLGSIFCSCIWKRMGCSMVWDGMLCAKGLVTRWYGTECSVRRDLWLDDMGRNALCVRIWKDTMFDGMGRNVLKGWDVRWYETECSVRKDLLPDDMGRNALCEGTYCPCEGIECPMWRNLVRYFLYLNCDSPIRRKLRVKKNGLSQCNNDLFQIIINKIFIWKVRE